MPNPTSRLGSLVACLFVFALLLPAPQARAVLLEADFAAPGDALLTIDTESGLVWLDWTYAAGTSFNQVSAELLPGGDLESFRYATNAEVTTFWLNAGIPDVPDITSANLTPVQALIELLGVTFSNSSVDAGSLGFTSETLGGLRYEATLADRTPFDGLGQATFNRTVGISDDSEDPSRGHALVRAIPEPGSATLLLAAAAALLLARQRGAQRPAGEHRPWGAPPPALPLQARCGANPHAIRAGWPMPLANSSSPTGGGGVPLASR